MSTYLDVELEQGERDFIEELHRLCREEIIPVRAELDADSTPPRLIMEIFRDNNVFRAVHRKEHGGLGMTPMMSTLVAETIAEYCLGIASTFGVSGVLSPLPLILAGTAEQKERYLPRLTSGEWIGAFAMTEVEAGSDIAALKTTAVKMGDRYVINGAKKWITNAYWADVLFVFAVTNPERDPRAGVSCFIVEKGTPGLTCGPLEDKLGLRCAPNSPVYLENVEVPAENIVGLEPDRGMLLAIDCLTNSRVSLAGASVGLATGAYKEAARYARKRRQFGKRLIDIQAVQIMLTNMLVDIEHARAMTYRAGWHTFVAKTRRAATYAAMAKYKASEIAMKVATDAVQLHGGQGFVKECPAEKMFRDAKILSIYEGTSQMLVNQISAAIMTESARY